MKTRLARIRAPFVRKCGKSVILQLSAQVSPGPGHKTTRAGHVWPGNALFFTGNREIRLGRRCRQWVIALPNLPRSGSNSGASGARICHLYDFEGGCRSFTLPPAAYERIAATFGQRPTHRGQADWGETLSTRAAAGPGPSPRLYLVPRHGGAATASGMADLRRPRIPREPKPDDGSSHAGHAGRARSSAP